jgi:IS1 family transposase
MVACPQCTHQHVVNPARSQALSAGSAEAVAINAPAPRREVGRYGKNHWRYFCHGVSMNVLGKMFGVRASSVLKWIRRYATEHYEKPVPTRRTIVLETDHWPSYASVIPAEELVMSNAHMESIERNHCRQRHWFGRDLYSRYNYIGNTLNFPSRDLSRVKRLCRS